MTQPQPQPNPEHEATAAHQERERSTPSGTYVCNVQSWGATPTYTQGQLIPDDCPYDLEAAHRQRKVLTVEEYKKAHPEWDPEEQAKAEAEAKLQAEIFPGYDPPTAAPMPDPVATKQLYDDAAAEAEGAAPKRETGQDTEPKPVQVQQASASTPPSPPRSTTPPKPAP